jgi:hypothetical protein
MATFNGRERWLWNHVDLVGVTIGHPYLAKVVMRALSAYYVLENIFSRKYINMILYVTYIL